MNEQKRQNWCTGCLQNGRLRSYRKDRAQRSVSVTAVESDDRQPFQVTNVPEMLRIGLDHSSRHTPGDELFLLIDVLSQTYRIIARDPAKRSETRRHVGGEKHSEVP